MRKTHYIPITADVPGAANDANCALIRRTIRTALAAEGETVISDIGHIDRGYASIEGDLRALGADIRRRETDA